MISEIGIAKVGGMSARRACRQTRGGNNDLSEQFTRDSATMTISRAR